MATMRKHVVLERLDRVQVIKVEGKNGLNDAVWFAVFLLSSAEDLTGEAVAVCANPNTVLCVSHSQETSRRNK